MDDDLKLTISECEIIEGKIEVKKKGGKNFGVMLNPSGFTHQHSISYSNSDSKSGQHRKRRLGKLAEEPKFSTYNPEKVSFNLVIDGTGVVSPRNAGEDYVKTKIDDLKDVVYNYEGEKHEPSIVRLSWGNFIFDGRLDSMTVEYTLFMPEGQPLRAKVGLSFGRYISKKEEALLAKRSSPNLTHIVEVKAGDTLPLLCYRIYKDSSYYAEVAKINNIVNFRGLKPGSRLEFPPLR